MSSQRLRIKFEGDPAMRDLARHVFGDRPEQPTTPETATPGTTDHETREFLANLFKKEN